MHLDKLAKGIKKGTVLKRGDLIGYVGNTGNAKYTPAHLHFEIRKGRKALDPYPRLTGVFTAKEQLAMLNSIIKILTDEQKKK
jgi:murein DD-endopeptidase MepM/ murein hydrolase activator NlpD